MAWAISNAMLKDCANSRSLQVPAEVSSEEYCSDGELSALLNTTPMPDQFYWPDKTTEHCRLSRFGMTCEPLTESLGGDLLTWFLAGFPVPTYQSPGGAQESREKIAVSGSNRPASFAKWNQNSCMWKTAQRSLLEDLELSLETWPRWGLMQHGECFHATMSAEFTYEKESGLSLPTPRACSAMAAAITENTANAKFPNLETVLARLTIPTIGANEGKGSSKNRYIGSPDFHGAKMSEGLRTCETDPIYLNPLFGELVMMWPLGWTDLRPLETGRLAEWLQQHSLSYQKDSE